MRGLRRRICRPFRRGTAAPSAASGWRSVSLPGTTRVCGGYCGGCAVDTATSTARSELNDACALAVSNEISPLRAELTPLREQNEAFRVELEELKLVHSVADEEHRDLRAQFELPKSRTPASPVAPELDMGPDRRSPKFDRCGAELGKGFASYEVIDDHGLPWSMALQEASPVLAQLVAGGRITAQVLLHDGSGPPAMSDYFYFGAQVRGVALESNGSGIELYVPSTGLRYGPAVAQGRRLRSRATASTASCR